MSVVGGLFLLVIVAAVYLGAAFVPAWMDSLAVREIAGNGLLEYVETDDEDKALERIHRELEKKGVQEWVTADACTFNTRGSSPTLFCDFVLYAYYPFTDAYKTLPTPVRVSLDGGKPVIQ